MRSRPQTRGRGGVAVLVALVAQAAGPHAWTLRGPTPAQKGGLSARRRPGPAHKGPRRRWTPPSATTTPAAAAEDAGDWPTAALSGGQIYEALDEFSHHAGKRVVVKYGGHAMSDAHAADCFAKDVVLMQRLGVKPVVVHGGGPQIGEMLERLQVPTRFVEGLRVTDAATIEVAEMVLGSINKAISAAIASAGGHALGLSGRDDSLIVAEKLVKKTVGDTAVDLGFVGTPLSVNADLLESLLDQRVIPVIAPIAAGTGKSDEAFSLNADTAAGAVAAALGASRLLLLTDVPGVLDGEGRLVDEVTPETAKTLIDEGVIRGGMLPKIETALYAVNSGVQGAAIVDGRIPHAVLKELFSPQGAGTLVLSSSSAKAEGSSSDEEEEAASSSSES
mmetsp:Transcript_5617/g.23344  ORF Transcript_5617/g.23344 Transcript_5617/m.23344 type:complete len:391 (+) Transcript_5617:41-1213(+)